MTNGIDLRAQIPKIKRARGYRLYDFEGRRYLDLCLDGGRALLGHRFGRSLLMMKNAMEKGLSASYPGIWEARLLKQLRMLYADISGCSVVFAGGPRTFPVFRPLEYESPGKADAFAAGLFELLLPLPGASAYRLICSVAGSGAELPEADHIPQFIYSGLCRAAADLKAFISGFEPGLLDSFDSPLWDRRGPWLYPSVDGSGYRLLFEEFLKRGILISPDPAIPSCVPAEFTEGEIKPIKDIERLFRGGVS